MQNIDVIISNPPYITDAEKFEMEEQVLQHEPNIALFVSNKDPLQFYKAILHFAQQSLAQKGMIFMEINKEYASEVQWLFEQAGFTTTLRNDIHGNARMVFAEKV